MKTENKVIEFKSKGQYDFFDITDQILEFVSKSGIEEGLVNIQILHTSAGLMLNENEPLLLEDIKNNLEKTASRSLEYRHNDLTKRTVNVCMGECLNGHSHCQAIHLPPTLTLNLIGGKLQLGTWQRIFFAELDSARQRKVQIKVLGD